MIHLFFIKDKGGGGGVEKKIKLGLRYTLNYLIIFEKISLSNLFVKRCFKNYKMELNITGWFNSLLAISY